MKIMESSFISFLLWAKTNQEDNNWHPLIWHLIDSGMVAGILWEKYLSSSFKQEFCNLFKLPDHDATNLLSFWISLHDIGKAGPAFQKKSKNRLSFLEKVGFKFPKTLGKEQGYHGLASTWILRDLFQEIYPDYPRFGNALAIVLGGHHGEFPTNEEINNITYQSDHLGDSFWEIQRQELIKILHRVFKPPKTMKLPVNRNEFNAMLILISGITTLSDWVASNSDYFHFNPDEKSIHKYSEKSLKTADFALSSLGWGGWFSKGEPLPFAQLFPDYEPNSLQKTVINITPKLKSPFLLIVEAQTGSGKTEAALFLADHEIQRNAKAGFYIAMPTQATSNQMYERTIKFLTHRYPEDRINVHLVHGAAILNEFVEKIRFQGINQDGEELANITSEEWFLPRKKTLLAPFGIGTVDQTFLSVLRSKHFFLRLYGLSHKVIIFDEVHAYDVYMVEIFKHLLAWLHAINSSVIILSATLPKQSRLEMIEAFNGDPNQIKDCDFPRLTIVDAEGSSAISAGAPENRVIKLNWINDEKIIETIKNNCADGGNVAIICNRVGRVQEVYERIVNEFPQEQVIAFHSRFPYCWRSEKETKILNLYGKDSRQRPSFSIVIATQVIEQSLDIDFDLMISDLSPIDLLIQRIGRLHRHQEKDNLRPKMVKKPTLFLIHPKYIENGFPDFGLDKFIYDKFILEKTLFTIRDKDKLNLPFETDWLINKVYSTEQLENVPDEFLEIINRDRLEMLTKNSNTAIKAENQLIPESLRNIFGKTDSVFSDEFDPRSFSIVQTQTRNMNPSVQVVCLLITENGLITLADKLPINLEDEPNKILIKSCLRSTINIADQKLVNLIIKNPTAPGWKKIPGLRTKIPMIFDNGVTTMDKYQIVLDPQIGLFTKVV